MAIERGFLVEVVDFNEVHTLPGSWPPDRYRELLERLDFDDFDSIEEADLPEMTAMAAQDEGLRGAANAILALIFGESMSDGVRQNLIDDLTGERPWEQAADLHRQSGIFEAVELLQQAFPNDFGIPDAARVRLRVTARGKRETEWLRKGPEASLVARLVAAAMDDRATLLRLYGDKLDSPRFPEAESIIWSTTKIEDRLDDSPPHCELAIFSSLQWFGPLRDAEGEVLSDAEPDEPA